MARIVYGVSGEGSGHSSRAREIAKHLLARGHMVRIVSYDRGYRSLKTDFDCMEIAGLHIISHENKVSALRTAWYNLKRLPAIIRSVRSLARIFTEFKPDCVLTDFEPCTAWLAWARNIPLISVDNQHRMRYMEYKVPRDLRWGQWTTRLIIQAMIPPPDYSLAITFFKGKVTNDRTFLFDPILRSEVCALQPSEGDFHLVYLSTRYDELLINLKRFPEHRFVIYGYDRNALEDNLQFREFSSAGFLEHLAACRSVIATAGFTLISEAMYLGKPYLAFPIRGQFEQELNAVCLEELGYGINGARADYDTIADFLASLPAFSQKLHEYRQGNTDEHSVELKNGCGNLQLKATLDRIISQCCPD